MMTYYLIVLHPDLRINFKWFSMYVIVCSVSIDRDLACSLEKAGAQVTYMDTLTLLCQCVFGVHQGKNVSYSQI